jgi:hypothetical protein
MKRFPRPAGAVAAVAATLISTSALVGLPALAVSTPAVSVAATAATTATSNSLVWD